MRTDRGRPRPSTRVDRSWTYGIAVGWLLVTMFVPAVAIANGTALPDTLDVALRPGEASSLALEANFGFLESRSGAPFTWICHEIFLPPTSSITPTFFEGSGDLLLATVRSLGIANDPDHSLYRAADGCEWVPAQGLTDVLIRDVAFDPLDPDHLLAVSSTGAGDSNGIWESFDGGVSWAKTSVDLPNRFFRSVRWSRADSQRAWASSTWYNPVGAWVHRTTNGGVSWSEASVGFAVEGTIQSQVDIAAASPVDPNRLYLRTDGSTDYLLLSTDGGRSFEAVFSSADNLRGVAFGPDGSVWAAAGESGAWRAEDGRNFLHVGDMKPRGVATDSRGLFVVGNNYSDGYALAIAETGTAFTPLFRFTELAGTRTCPAGSDVQTICDPLWPALEQKLGIATPTPTPSPTATPNASDGDGGCACRLDAAHPVRGAVYTAAFLAMALLVTRRIFE